MPDEIARRRPVRRKNSEVSAVHIQMKFINVKKESAMKKSSLVFISALSLADAVFAQSDNMQGMDMKGMDAKNCANMMKGTDAQKCKDMMGSKGGMQADTHQADGTVKAIDKEKLKITLAHGPVKTLNWPAMTMGFSVKDKSMLDKMTVGQKVHVEFVKQGNDYVVTSIK
jgi:Cu/Ag efflux protein CusF